MADDGENLTPFWVQNTTNLRRTERLRHQLSSLIFNAGLLLIILLVTAVFFLVFIVPSTFSIFKPSNVKKSWDSVNVVLVLVAVIFGFLTRNKNEERNSDEYHQISSPSNIQKSDPSTPNSRWFNEIRNPNPITPRTWFDNVDRNSFSNTNGGGSLRRSFSSYPDLCEVSPRWIAAEDHWRFYDDTNVDTYRFSDPSQLNRRRSWRDVDRSPEPEIKTIFEDHLESIKVPTFTQPASIPPLLSPPSPPSPPPAPAPEKVKRASHSVPRKKERKHRSKSVDNFDIPATLPPPPPPPPIWPPSPAPIYEEKVKRASHSVPRKSERATKRRENYEAEGIKVVMAAPATLPPPPPPPPPLPQYMEPRSSKSDKKRGGASATKEFINSLYHKKKRKNRSKSVDNFDALLHKSEPPPLHYQWPASSTPPPTPPPPPPLFQNLFTSKKGRKKRNAPPPSPPPPPPLVRISRPNPAPKPVKIRSFDSVEENSNSGGESPLIPIPPPPPPPPFFKKHAWKFVVQGDYVRIDSTVSSRSESPELEDLDSADSTPTSEDVADDRPAAFAPSPLFCPSPDVNTKAENFISKFRAGLKLEKINSFNKNDQSRGLSNLGPGVCQS
ncbi:hypothetical protein RND71_029143 [Anisodus tanguticus]|uniref:Uncharacterized protein n=1 Tax=Anisodus tanguticus TaxID=243964 RepID=A0AAE1RDY3_9SOLA|nr:hypothetical protein RND71_029143 [Anisodus tanguticus]